MIKRTVLVVDDQQINRKILGRILSDEYEILYAENGKKALELLRSEVVISAVLLDIVMPVMNGYEVLEEMHGDSVLSKIPVIVSSQKDGEEDEIRALSVGAYDFIAKPYKPDVIRHRLHNMIRFRETAAMVNRVERDELTGLYNKQFFMDKVRDKLEKSPEQQFVMLCLGVERFKLINDTYGEEEGDQVLCHIAKVLRKADEPLQLCGRFSADEFYALLPGDRSYDNESLSAYYQEINEFPIDMEIKIHCGMYAVRGDEKSINMMCDRAKLAADANRGKYNVLCDYYNDSMRDRLVEEQFLTSHMYAALEEHQFEVYYQPKYDLSNETIAGAEALVRWFHPEKGFLSPGAFIPLFEKNGFITRLDRYVWENVCRDIRSWLDKGYPPIAVSVNVSRADIYNPKLTDLILELVAKYRVPMRYLHLEITESAYTDNPDQIIDVVGKLRGLGFIIEMDDFGSGYSSLNMLAKMPVDVLKLDMKFVQMDSENASGKGIMSFVISLAKWLNLAVVAEGVETADQIASLRSMDCNYVQGFYYARPMERSKFEALLLSSSVTEMICTNKTVEEYTAKTDEEVTWTRERELLIVDDIEVNRAVLASAFVDEYDIVEKENGKDAYEYLLEHHDHIEVVLLDLLMPVMDGFQLLDKIRKNPDMCDLPVIITSQGDAQREQRALELKADDFISKPYKIDLIRHRVRNVVQSYQYQRMHHVENWVERMDAASGKDGGCTPMELLQRYVEAQKPHFDIVRLVDPRQTVVCETKEQKECSQKYCFSIWGKQARCNNCISLKALESRGRCCKLEYSSQTLYFVIAEYVPYGGSGAVVEMVTKLESEYIDNVFEKDLLYMSMDELHKQLEYDDLTGIFNRRHIDKYLPIYVEHAKMRGKNVGIAMIDIDCFKTLNDTFGHLAGDEALKHVAEILTTNIARSKGDFVARFGGDEFLIVCRNIPEKVFIQRLQAVADLVRHMADTEDSMMGIGISAGCVNTSEYPGLDMMGLVKKADERLYKAKHYQKGKVIAED